MRKVKAIVAVISILATAQVFAHDMGDMDKSCSTIADACKAAGFVQDDTAGKGFWMDCMHPILLGKTVTGVTVSSADVKSCRTHKIAKMKTELKELEAIK